MFPSDCVKSAAVYHLSGTPGQKQSYPGTASATISGAFLPLDRREHALEGGDMVDPHEFYVEPVADIRTADKLVIEGVTYFVKKVFSPSYFGGLRHKRVSLSTQS